MKPKPKRLKRYSQFCGIDVGKNTHVARIIDSQGQNTVRSQSFRNDAAGFDRLIERLTQAGKIRQILIAMEATGHYWYCLHDFLKRLGYDVVLLNPVQTSQQAKKGIRKRKTDKIDAGHIATLIKNSEHRPAHIPDDTGMTCRQLSRLWYSLVKQRSRVKQLIRSRLHPVWPEFETFFGDMFSITSRTLLNATPIPEDLLAMGQDDLTELIRKTSRGRLSSRRAQRIWETTEKSVGMRRGLEGARIGIRSLLSQLDALRPVQDNLEQEIKSLAEQLPPFLLSLPGINHIRAVSLFGEVDPVIAFASPDKLVAFSGLDVAVFQSGQYDGKRRRISKRGSPFLRKTLWMMTHLAIRTESDLRSYYLRRKKNGSHHLAAVTATAVKLCRITWRIMTDERDYIP